MCVTEREKRERELTSTHSFERMKCFFFFFFSLFQFFCRRINVLLGAIRELMIYSACPVVRPTPLMSPGLKHKRRKRKPTLDDDMPPLNVSLSPSIYTHSLIQSQQETHPLYIYSLHSVNSAPSSSSAVTPPPRSCSSSCYRMPQWMLTSAGQTNNDSQSRSESDLLSRTLRCPEGSVCYSS